MKRILLLSVVMLSVVAYFGCKKSDVAAQNDNSNLGTYKGIFVGSSGTITITLNSDKTVTAVIKVDGQIYNFTCTQTIQINKATTLNFTCGTDKSFTFSIDANGGNPQITNLVFAGHPNALMNISKELSTRPVKCYEGTYTGTSVATGTFNLIIYGDKVLGIGKTGNDVPYAVAGTISNNQITATGVLNHATFTGTVNGDNVSGTWSYLTFSGTWTGVKKQ
ncbi:hypothetical protein OCK74_26105 [Chitinophagaceae bacterium LB-8]|uniref:Lipocalin-like domain-containing protein n=1 Tax=Paraflavisolibacter caeni TaxID=2982496 RepID=A0A9X3B9X5_9BACT|nr:hypothetical protein [Paraflavisolibacter caeni]MCU7552620.1 hypothetical protein [Paraflavisolibacter caeni]